MKRKHIYAIFICTAIFLIGEASVQYSMQPPVNYTGSDGSTCAQCHGNFNNGGGSVVPAGLPVGTYVAGQEYNFSITVSHPGTRGRWGFSIAARDANHQPVGTFSDNNPNAAPNDTELSHFMAVFFTGTSFTYDNLKWTAPVNPTPAQKNITFYYIGNAANGDRGPGGDFIYSGSSNAVLAPPVNKLPVVMITQPLNGSIFKAGSTITVKAAASDSDGVVKKVEFFNVGADNSLFRLAEDSANPYELTGTDVEPGNYRLLAKATDDSSAVAHSDTVNVTVTGCSGSGSISAYGYANIPGTQVGDLISNPSYPNNPSLATTLASFEYAGAGDNYGGRLRGYICAPQTGNYTFYIAANDQAGLLLSTSEDTASKVLIAYNETPVGFHEWTNLPTQKSAPIRLIKGARYYIETLHKQGTGADHLSVGWVLPDGTAEGPIPGNRLSPWGSSSSAIAHSGNTAFSLGMHDARQETGNTNGMTITAMPNPFTGYFTLCIKSNDHSPVTITITDVLGKVVEKIISVNANSSAPLGSKLQRGVYFVEVMQGGERKRVKVIKQ